MRCTLRTGGLALTHAERADASMCVLFFGCAPTHGTTRKHIRTNNMAVNKTVYACDAYVVFMFVCVRVSVCIIAFIVNAIVIVVLVCSVVVVVVA